MKTYQKLAGTIQARANCEKSGNSEWEHNHDCTIQEIMRDMPSGSGIDSGNTLGKSNSERIVIESSFHNMTDGYYDGWIDYTITITPSLQHGFLMAIKGNFGKHQGLKDYLMDTYYTTLAKDMS